MITTRLKQEIILRSQSTPLPCQYTRSTTLKLGQGLFNGQGKSRNSPIFIYFEPVSIFDLSSYYY